MRRSLTLAAILSLLPLLSAPAHAGFDVYCDAATGAAMLKGAPQTPQDEYVAGKAFNSFCKTPDHEQAKTWLLKSAEHGYMDAQYELAEMYFTGYGAKLDYVEAKKWYLKAAEQGHGQAQLRLGFLFAEKHFEGLTADLAEAEKWFRKAAEQDAKDARFRLGNFYLNYKEPPDEAQAKEWLLKAAQAGHRSAMFDYGRLLMKQKETMQEGEDWVVKAADAGELQAQVMAAELYQKRRDFKPEEYLHLVQRVAQQPNAPVFFLNKAGDMLFDGYGGTPRNYPAARRYYERAGMQNDAYALRQLANIYKEGLGVKKDEARAAKLLDRASRYR